MLKRKNMNILNDWFKEPNKTALLIKGPRGVGKTTLVEQFARENYANTVYLNFETFPLQRSIFSGSLDLGNLTKQITLKLSNTKLIPKKTLIILDEVHLCPRAREAVETFLEEEKYDVIMITSHYASKPDVFEPMPLLHETVVEMSGLDFEEFLWANGVSDVTISEVKDHFDRKVPIPVALHQEFMSLFREYMVVGGMPEVVYSFVNKHNFKTVLRLQKRIIQSYEDDIHKYLKKTDRKKVSMCFNSIPTQLVKQNKKFMYGVVEVKGNARKFESSILWLYDAGMIEIAFQLEDLQLPFANNARFDIFKVYFKDVGLLTGLLGPEAQQTIIDGNINAFNDAILESVTADLLMKRGHRLYYFTKNATLEMEFMIKYNNLLTGLSVNNADNTKAKALTSLFENHDLPSGIELTRDNLEIIDNLHRYPLYCIMFI